MNIEALTPEKQVEWLIQRGWQRHPELANTFIDPNTRMNCYQKVAVSRAVAECRTPADLTFNVDAARRKDDAPFPRKP